MQKNSFTAMIKRFFAPIKGKPRFLLANVIVNCFYSFFTILTVEVFKKATSLVQNNDSEGVRNLILMYVGIIVVYVIFSWFTRNV
jgi:hypothetical protein